MVLAEVIQQNEGVWHVLEARSAWSLRASLSNCRFSGQRQQLSISHAPELPPSSCVEDSAPSSDSQSSASMLVAAWAGGGSLDSFLVQSGDPLSQVASSIGVGNTASQSSNPIVEGAQINIGLSDSSLVQSGAPLPRVASPSCIEDTASGPSTDFQSPHTIMEVAQTDIVSSDPFSVQSSVSPSQVALSSSVEVTVPSTDSQSFIRTMGAARIDDDSFLGAPPPLVALSEPRVVGAS